MPNIMWTLLLLWAIPMVFNAIVAYKARDWSKPIKSKEMVVIFCPGYNLFIMFVIIIAVILNYK